MSSIQPISTSRVTDAMTRDRLTAQIQNDQLDLFKLQNQLSTGQRIFLPSDDPSSAQRAMVLQRTIERKEQSLTNLIGARSSLATTDGALTEVSTGLIQLKSDALAAINSVASESDRLTAIRSIDELFNSLVNVGNSTFTSNYLLGGAERAAPPFARSADGFFVEYYGDESSPQTYIDIGQLFDTGVSGDDVFGGLSEAVRGTADLNAQLTPETGLDQINGGLGLKSGASIELTFIPASSDPAVSTVIDLSQAKTIDDVVRLVEAKAPADADLTVTTQGGGLQIDVGGGTITIGEVANGTTARELGILSVGAPSNSISGADLDPTLQLTTRIDELVGARAIGRLEIGGDNNDLVLTAGANGDTLNDVTVRFVDGPLGASYDDLANELTVSIDPGETTAAEAAQLINDEGTFTAETDPRDQLSFELRGQGAVSVGDFTNATSGGVDGGIDLASGLVITNGRGPETIDTSGVETVEQLLNVLNDPQFGLEATINTAGDGIDVRTRRSGAAFSIGENGGTTATDLGIRTYTESSRLADFNRGLGVVVEPSADEIADLTGRDRDDEVRRQNTFEIAVVDQGVTTTYEIDPIGLETVDDLINRINETTGETRAPDGTLLTEGAITASLSATGNGLTLTRNYAVDPLDPAVPASAIASLTGGDIEITADAAGVAGNIDFNIEVIDSAAGGLSTDYDSDTNTIRIDLGGDTPDTTTVAVNVSAAVPGYTVAASGVVGNVAVTAAQDVAVTGGYDADPDSFTVTGTVAQRLGFFAEEGGSATSAGDSLQSTDNKPEEVEGVFTTLARMREALEANDIESLEREIDRLDDDIDRVAFSRAEVGVRLRNLDSVADRLADEEVTLRDALSQEIDADLVDVISEFTAKQAALQASLQTTGRLLNLSVLDFI